MSALSIRPVLATRSHRQIRDLFVSSSSGQHILLVADGAAIEVDSDCLHNLILPTEGPVLAVMHALSAVLKTEEMAQFLRAWLLNGRGWNGLARALQGHADGEGAAQPGSEADFLSLASLSLNDRTIAAIIPPMEYRRSGPATFEVLKTLHLVYEDLRLVECRAQDARKVGILAGQLALSLNAREWVDRYLRDGLHFESRPFEQQSQQQRASVEPPPDLLSVLSSRLTQGPLPESSYPSLGAAPDGYFGSLDAIPTTTFVLHIYSLLNEPRHIPNAILERGYRREDVESLSFGVGLPIREALRSMQISASDEGWSKEAYELVGREDLAALENGVHVPAKISKRTGSNAAARFSNDLRVKEVEKMLQYTNPVTTKVLEKPGIR
jgi:hypothetical protein